jgi:hypothetical protein
VLNKSLDEDFRTLSEDGVARSGSPGFQRFADHLRHVCAIEAETARDSAVQRSGFRASLIAEPAVDVVNLDAVYSHFRSRSIGRGGYG